MQSVNQNLNKKLWSFLFGCIITASYIWVMTISKQAPILEVFHPYPWFVEYYYIESVTALMTLLTTFVLLVMMKKGLGIALSEHPFWLILPSATFLALAMVAATGMLSTVAFAVVPAMLLTLAKVARCRRKRALVQVSV